MNKDIDWKLLFYFKHLKEYQAIIDEIKKAEGTSGYAIISSYDIAEKTGIPSSKVAGIISSMCKAGGVLEKTDSNKPITFYHVKYADISESPFSEIPLVYFYVCFLDLDNPKVKDKIKRCGVSLWAYQRARAYLNEGKSLRDNEDYSVAFFTFLVTVYLSNEERINSVLDKNREIVKEEALAEFLSWIQSICAERDISQE